MHVHKFVFKGVYSAIENVQILQRSIIWLDSFYENFTITYYVFESRYATIVRKLWYDFQKKMPFFQSLLRSDITELRAICDFQENCLVEVLQRSIIWSIRIIFLNTQCNHEHCRLNKTNCFKRYYIVHENESTPWF